MLYHVAKRPVILSVQRSYCFKVAQAMGASAITREIPNPKTIPDWEQSGRRLAKFAERYGIKEVYSDYSRMVRMAKADFVYIALVNDAHFEYAKEALEHGLNVIVEKPMCPTAKEVKLLADMDVPFKEIFAEDQPDLARKYDVVSAPTMIVGGERLVGFGTIRKYLLERKAG